MKCEKCKVKLDQYTLSARHCRILECPFCSSRISENPGKPESPKSGLCNRKPPLLHSHDETGSFMVRIIKSTAIWIQGVSQSCKSSRRNWNEIPAELKDLILEHHIFHLEKGWKEAQSILHPNSQHHLTNGKVDYD